MEAKNIDHLFRHHSGKMVSVLTRILKLLKTESLISSENLNQKKTTCQVFHLAQMPLR